MSFTWTTATDQAKSVDLSPIVEAGKLWESSFSNLSKIAEKYQTKVKTKNTTQAQAALANATDPNEFGSMLASMAERYNDETLDFDAVQKYATTLSSSRAEKEKADLLNSISRAQLDAINRAAEHEKHDAPILTQLLPSSMSGLRGIENINTALSAVARTQGSAPTAQQVKSEEMGRINQDWANYRAANPGATYAEFSTKMAGLGKVPPDILQDWTKGMATAMPLATANVDQAVEEIRKTPPTSSVRATLGEEAAKLFPERGFFTSGSPLQAAKSAEDQFNTLMASYRMNASDASGLIRRALKETALHQEGFWSDSDQFNQSFFEKKIKEYIRDLKLQ